MGLGSELGSPLLGTVFETLVVRGSDGLKNHLATSINVSANGTSIDIYLRPDVVFHDGRALSAVDVARSINAARAAKAPMASDLADVVAVAPLGLTAVRLRLKRANFYVPRMLAEVPIHRRLARIADHDEQFVGTGPYQFADLKLATDSSQKEKPPDAGVASVDEADLGSIKQSDELGQTLHLVARKSPWGEVARSPGIAFVAIPKTAAALAAVQIGRVDIAEMGAFPRSRSRFGGSELRTIAVTPFRLRFLIFNGERSLFRDSEVRRAASLTIDRKPIAVDGYRAIGVARQHPVWPGGPISAADRAVTKPAKARAKELLDRAGWIRKRGRESRERDKQKLIAIVVTGEKPEPATELLFDQLRSIGFVLDVRRHKPSELKAVLKRGQFDLAIGEWTGAPDWDLSALYESGGRLAIGNVRSSQIDRAFGALRQARNETERAARSELVIEALEELVPLVTLVELQRRLVLGPRVRGIDEMYERLELAKLHLAPDRDPSLK